ncbi:MAG: class I mannose-6-phosphate isomerase [Rikenellaceae bacterium]|nr:class I mannose-6-phosphate isomerase [Rikenellaceae bacterium]
MLYPLKFKPQLKERIWGGTALRERLASSRMKADVRIGESWEISGFEDDMSVVSEGRLKGNTIGELMEVFMGELVGDQIYNQFGTEFPLLIKYMDAEDLLSIQVHPGNAQAARLHNAWGKSEMWYITECEEDAEILIGLKEGITPEKFAAALTNGTVPDLLNRYSVHKGDSFYIPAGTVHCICGGIKLVEIQQTSDITYRIYDWDRTDSHGHPRELNPELAMQAIRFDADVEYVRTKASVPNEVVELVDCTHFTTNLIEVSGAMTRDLAWLPSFVIYICTEGSGTMRYSDGELPISKGDVYLVPAVEQSVRFEGSLTMLESYC